MVPPCCWSPEVPECTLVPSFGRSSSSMHKLLACVASFVMLFLAQARDIVEDAMP
jgi:hypothetical protein